MTTLLTILMITTIIVLIGFVIGACYFLDQIQKEYENIYLSEELLRVEYKYLKESYDYANKIIDKVLESNENLNAQVKIIDEQYRLMLDGFNKSTEFMKTLGIHYTVISNNTKQLGERYDNIYEEFKRCNDELIKLKVVLEPWCIDSEQIEEEKLDVV